MVSRSITIELSLVKESIDLPINQVISDIINSFSNGDFVIPWIDSLKKVTLKDDK